VLQTANLLQLVEVKEACCDFLQSQICPTNCIGIYAIADLHSCMKLVTSSELYIQQHFLYEILFIIIMLKRNFIYYCYILTLREIVDGDEILSLSSEQMVKLISSDKLVVPSEEKVSKLKLINVIFYCWERKIQ